jgi:hypothetical protein
MFQQYDPILTFLILTLFTVPQLQAPISRFADMDVCMCACAMLMALMFSDDRVSPTYSDLKKG